MKKSSEKRNFVSKKIKHINMASRTVFNDDSNNEMDCYLNDKGEVYISVGTTGEDSLYSGFITLNKEDVQKLIQVLTKLESEMEA